jgi:hypothetical protein
MEGIDKISNTSYTSHTMTTSKITQQLRNPDPELWKEIKAKAIMAEQTMTEWVEDACRQKIAADTPK